MSSSDWEISGSTTAVIHTTLTPNPLTSSIGGDYGRLLTPINNSSNAHMALSTGSQFYNVPITKAIRAEGCFRLSPTGYPSPSGLNLKSSGMLSPGYLYGLTTYYGGTQLCLWLPSQGTIVLNDIAGYYPDRNSWISLRMELYPLSITADKLILYREQQIGNGNWITVYETTILSSSPDYRPWSSNNRNGIFVFREYYNDPNVGLYMDNVKFTLSNV